MTYPLSAIGYGSHVGRNLAETGSILFQSRIYEYVSSEFERLGVKQLLQ